MKERRSKLVVSSTGLVQEDGRGRKTKEEVSEEVREVHGQSTTELVTPRTRLKMRHDPTVVKRMELEQPTHCISAPASSPLLVRCHGFRVRPLCAS